jgi:hypothetical protein
VLAYYMLFPVWLDYAYCYLSLDVFLRIVSLWSLPSVSNFLVVIVFFPWWIHRS